MTNRSPYVSSLDKSTRETSTKLLNSALVDAISLSTAIKQAHWTIQGPSFIGLHELLDGVNERMREAIDTIAERCIILGGQTTGTLQQAESQTDIEPYPSDITWQGDHVEELTKRLMAFGGKLRTSIEKAGEAGDEDTADLFTEISRVVDKDAWFIGAHANDTKIKSAA